MGLFSKEKIIKRVKLLGMRTARQTLVFTTVNFSLYSFFVEYTDGSSETIELSPNNPNSKGTAAKNEKRRFNQLMELANTSYEEPHTQSSSCSLNPIGDLKDLKSLFDDGLVSEDIYEAKKEELLAQISGQSSPEPLCNMVIRRKHARPAGEAKTVVIIDGEKHKDLDLDHIVKETLSAGMHTVLFKRGTVSSKEYEVTVPVSKHVEIVFNPKTFSIEVDVLN